MNQKAQRELTRALRHNPELLELHPDKAGYCSVAEVIRGLRNRGFNVKREEIEAFALNIRFSFRNERHDAIRADYGNSIGLALADMYESPSEPPEILFHGSHADALSSIQKDGLIRFAYGGKKARDHVFLTESAEIALKKGGRHGTSVVLPVLAAKMAADGYAFYHAKEDIWLTDHIPPEYIDFNGLRFE